VGSFPAAVAAADLNGDGALDLVSADSFDDAATILLGHGDASFEAQEIATGLMPMAVVVADLDRTRTPDLVTPNALSGDISSLLNGLPPRTLCTGDCNERGSVALDELVLVVNVALGRQPVEACVAADPNGEATVTIDEVIEAVDNALSGCAAESVSLR
jgi:hypothetical protein